VNENEPGAIETVVSESPVDYAASKRRIVMMLLVFSAIIQIISGFLPDEATPLDFVVGVPLLILGISWCFTDAAQRDYRIGRLTKLLLIFLFIVGLPVYLFQTRVIGAFKTLALTMVLVGAMVACMFVTAFVTLFICDVAGINWTPVDG
jgi:hypothetical protein